LDFRVAGEDDGDNENIWPTCGCDSGMGRQRTLHHRCSSGRNWGTSAWSLTALVEGSNENSFYIDNFNACESKGFKTCSLNYNVTSQLSGTIDWSKLYYYCCHRCEH